MASLNSLVITMCLTSSWRHAHAQLPNRLPTGSHPLQKKKHRTRHASEPNRCLKIFKLFKLYIHIYIEREKQYRYIYNYTNFVVIYVYYTSSRKCACVCRLNLPLNRGSCGKPTSKPVTGLDLAGFVLAVGPLGYDSGREIDVCF